MTPHTTGVSAELERIYRDAVYRIVLSDGESALRIGEASPLLQAWLAAYPSAGGVFVTACNPFGRVCDAERNALANARLKADLQRRFAAVLPGYGASPDGSWREDSFFAFPVSKREALSLCRRYAQNAVVYVGADGVPELVFHPDIVGDKR